MLANRFLFTFWPNRASVILILNAIEVPNAFEYLRRIIFKRADVSWILACVPTWREFVEFLLSEMAIGEFLNRNWRIQFDDRLTNSDHHIQNEIPILMSEINREILSHFFAWNYQWLLFSVCNQSTMNRRITTTKYQIWFNPNFIH